MSARCSSFDSTIALVSLQLSSSIVAKGGEACGVRTSEIGRYDFISSASCVDPKGLYSN